MSEKQIGLGRLFIEEAIRAGAWGAVSLLVMAVFITAIKQDIKEGIDFGMDRFISEVVFLATDPALVEKTKQLVKEGIEYSVTKAAQGAREVLREVNVDAKSPAQPKPKTPESRPARQ